MCTQLIFEVCVLNWFLTSYCCVPKWITFNNKNTMQWLWKDRFIDVLLCMSFLALSIVAIFFMKEVINQYASNDTGLKQSEMNITQYPAVTICLKFQEISLTNTDLILSFPLEISNWSLVTMNMKSMIVNMITMKKWLFCLFVC